MSYENTLILEHVTRDLKIYIYIYGAEAFLASPQRVTTTGTTGVLRQAYSAAKMGLCAVYIPRIKNKVRSCLKGYC